MDDWYICKYEHAYAKVSYRKYFVVFIIQGIKYFVIFNFVVLSDYKTIFNDENFQIYGIIIIYM